MTCFSILPTLKAMLKAPVNYEQTTPLYKPYSFTLNLASLLEPLKHDGIGKQIAGFRGVFFSVHNTVALKQKATRIQFYMHDIVGGPQPTAVRVAGRSNFTGQDSIAAMFGSISVMDNPLTATPSMNSTLVGRAQGIYAMSSQEKELSLLMTLTYAFTTGPYSGSTFSVVGRNPVMKEVREMPVVGGTGKFRLARGYCLARTYSMTQMEAVIGYNVTLLHY